MDDPNITMEVYIRLEKEKSHRRGKVYNWETATYDNLKIDLKDDNDKVNVPSFPSPKPTHSRYDVILGYGYGVSTSCAVLGSWSDSGEEDDEKVKEETCFVA
nr:hypothetical protein [Tanacetum cinerariifolium]